MNGINPVPVSPSAARGWKKAERVTRDVAPTKLTTSGCASASRSRSRSFSKAEPVDDPDPDRDSDSDRDCDSDCDSPDVAARPIRTPLPPPSFPSSRAATRKPHRRRKNGCSVCFQNEARYECPRCGIPYCSAACYRNHTKGATNGLGAGNPSGSCTEEFFREKVASIMKLEASEREADARRALNRYHHQQRELQTGNPLRIRDVGNGGGDDGDGDDGDDGDDDDVYNLYQLWSQLEALEDRQTELPPAEIAKLLPPSLRNRFESDLRNGRVEADLVLDRWHPWWARELVGASASARKSENANGTNADSRSLDDFSALTRDKDKSKRKRKKTLDERFLLVPSFAGLGKKTSGATATATATMTTPRKNETGNPPTAARTDEALFFNLLDILRAVCRTLRLYHGAENAARQAPVEAAGTLIASSAVLGRDARFASMARALDDRCHHRHYRHYQHSFRAGRNGSGNGSGKGNGNGNGNDASNAEWLLHAQDTAALVESPRLVGRALLEASDVLKAAMKELKSSGRGASKKATTTNTNTNTNIHADDGGETETEMEIKRKQFFRVRKKLEFYLSWTLRHPVASKTLLGVSAGDEIRDWIEERRRLWNDYNRNRNDECSNGNIDSNSCGNIDIDNPIDSNSCGNGIAIIDGLGDRADDRAIATLKFPANPSQTNGGRKCSRTESPTERSQQQPPPLMVEVQSRRKQQNQTRGNSNQ